MFKITAMGHECPACKEPVYGKLPTKRYCNKYCRFKYNKRKVRQLKDRTLELDVFEKKNYEIMEFTMGASKNYFKANLDELRKKGFRTSKYCYKDFHNGIRVFVIEQYVFYVKGEDVHIFRRGEVKEFLAGVEERWKLDFPCAVEVLKHFDGWSKKVLGFELRGLDIWKLSREIIKKIEVFALSVFGVWRI